MFTIFHLWWGIATVTGMALGFRVSLRHFGLLGALAGAVVGYVLGSAVGMTPWRITQWLIFRGLAQKSTEELWASLRDPAVGGVPNFVLVELLERRGEDKREGLRLVLEMLMSEDGRRRWSGWVALNWAFPALFRQFPDYKPGASPEERCAVVERIERAFLE